MTCRLDFWEQIQTISGKSSRSPEITHYHFKPDLLPRADQHYCNRTLMSLPKSSPSVRCRWLRHVKKARLNNYLHDGKRQTLMKKYYQVQQPTTFNTPRRITHLPYYSRTHTVQYSTPDDTILPIITSTRLISTLRNKPFACLKMDVAEAGMHTNADLPILIPLLHFYHGSIG